MDGTNPGFALTEAELGLIALHEIGRTNKSVRAAMYYFIYRVIIALDYNYN